MLQKEQLPVGNAWRPRRKPPALAAIGLVGYRLLVSMPVARTRKARLWISKIL
jgi:hypothetical protein